MDVKDILVGIEAAKTAGLIPTAPVGIGPVSTGAILTVNDALAQRELAIRVAEERQRLVQEADYRSRMVGLGWSVGSYALVGGLGIILGALVGLFWRGRR